MAHINQQLVEERLNKFGKLYLIDDIIRRRAQDEEQVPILGYPRYEDNAAEYEFFTGRDLDRMVDAACRALIKDGFRLNDDKTIGLFAQSDLSFVVTFFALFRLGYKVLTISIRLGAPACLTLLERADCGTVLHGNTRHITTTLAEVSAARPGLTLKPMLPRSAYDDPAAPPQPPFERPIADLEAEHTRVTLMMHSSGSTGFPKPLLLSHRSLLNTLVSGTGLKAFNALPWYHLHGLITSVQAMWMRQTAHLFNPNLPLTANNLIAALETIQPEICHCVPYGLKLIAEQERGVELLRKCKAVTSAGAPTPDELGDRMIRAGVKLGVLLGLTEVGHVGDSVLRQPGDDDWDYIRFYPHVLQHMVFKPIAPGSEICESVYLPSHPALMVTNTDDPVPGSYGSGDLFTAHPSIPGAWKFVARNDDRITLLSGEKILPLVMEGCVRESPLARDALMVGNDRLVPGMLIFRAKSADHLSDEEYVDAVWPDVERANRVADEFARLTRDMVLPIPSEVDYPATDKKNIIRAQCYRVFADRIEGLYDRRGRVASDLKADKLVLSKSELEKFILKSTKDQAGISMPDTKTDFFIAGIDSLRAAQIRRLLLQSLDLGGHDLPTNVVYDAGNVGKLAAMLYELRTGKTANGDGVQAGDTQTEQIAQMEEMVEEYGQFDDWAAGSKPLPEKDTVLLTGATGALGAHILHQLLHSPQVAHVYLLVRGADPWARVAASLAERGLPIPTKDLKTRVTALSTSNIGEVQLGLSNTTFDILQSTTTLIIHAAWPVNFNLGLASFAPHLQGLHNLLTLSLNVPFKRPARALFASSISTAFNLGSLAGVPGSGVSGEGDGKPRVPEAPAPSLQQAADTGYARSKLVAERICERAAAASCSSDKKERPNVAVLRIGQIVGDTQKAIWNVREAVPLMVRSAEVIGALPLLEGGKGDCPWIPVDVVAKACLEITDGLAGRASVNQLDRSNGSDAATNTATANRTNGAKETNGTNGSNGHAVSASVTRTRKPLFQALYCNLIPPKIPSWNRDILPALSSPAIGLQFTPVPLLDWLDRLRTKGQELGDDAEAKLPALKLAGYFEHAFGEGGTATGGTKGLDWEIEEAYKYSRALRESGDLGFKLLSRTVLNWREGWKKNA